MKLAHPLVIAVLAAVASAPLASAQVFVSSPDELKAALENARPGQEIVIRDGSYHDWSVAITNSGTAAAPIVIRAETPGKVNLSGDSNIRLGGDFVTIRGICFSNGHASGEIWHLSGSNQRITDCAILDYKDGGHKWIRIASGTRNRLDHNYISGKTERDVTLQIDVSDSAERNHHRIDHNYFGPRPRGSGNGWETIRNGYSHQQNNPAHNLFEFNLFHQCDGENEIISSKSSYNTYRCNTFRDCAGELTLRHGKFNLVEGNYFFGRRRGSAGIRIIGEGHRVVNNYVDGTYGIGIQIYEGEDNAQATGYQAANDLLVAFNTVVNNRGNGINVRDYPRTPRKIEIANNLLVGNVNAVSSLSPNQLRETYFLHGNIAFDNPVGVSAPESAVRIIDPRMLRDSYGVLRPANDSPILGAAVTNFMNFGFQVDRDIDGQGRPMTKDVGADQLNGSGPLSNRPLDTVDIGVLVGPSWPIRK